jgi:serine/threonine protein kinase
VIVDDLQPSNDSPTAPSGRLVLAHQQVGKYRLVKDLGTGGMARVFLASLDGPDGFAKPYVLKRILPEYSRDEQFSRMFAIEAKVASMLSHPNIVNVFEFSRDADEYFLVLEYVAGASLDRIVHRARRQSVQLGPEVAVEIGIAVARALAYAHNLTLPDGTPLELVHRDVSPGNVLVSYDGDVKLTDFGVVKTSITATVAGVVKGKWSYMSPEQISSGPVDQRSDIFSLGVVLYELATGVRLFRGDSIGATAVRVMKAAIPPPRTISSEVDARLEAILLKALARDPNARYQDAAALAADLEAYRASRSMRVTAARLGSIVKLLFPEEGTSGVRGLGRGDALLSELANVVTIGTGAALADQDVKVEFEHEGDERPDDTVSGAFVAAVVGACLIGSMVFWSFVY